VKNTMIGWKVTNENYKSAAVDGKAGVYYPLNVKARAPKYLAKQGYHLTFFKTREDAINFIPTHHFYKIVKVKARKIIKKLPPMKNIRDISWRTSDLTLMPASELNWPKGTLMAKYITRLTD